MKLPKSLPKPKKRKVLFLRRVNGKSMQPTLKAGQIIIASGYFRKLAPDSVVVIHHDKLEKIKRLHKIKGNKIFVIGDNPRASLDSRSFGWLDVKSVLGKVLWPKI